LPRLTVLADNGDNYLKFMPADFSPGSKQMNLPISFMALAYFQPNLIYLIAHTTAYLGYEPGVCDAGCRNQPAPGRHETAVQGIIIPRQRFFCSAVTFQQQKEVMLKNYDKRHPAILPGRQRRTPGVTALSYHAQKSK
jgi:hypothetical protein